MTVRDVAGPDRLSRRSPESSRGVGVQAIPVRLPLKTEP